MGLNILIIGSTRGIGREVVKQLCSKGHNMFCISRNEDALYHLKTECLGIYPALPVHTLAYDISTFTSGSFDLSEKIKNTFGRIDVLLYNAGYLIKKDFDRFNPDEVMEIFKVNFLAAGAIIQHLLSLMGGEKMSHIVTIGSMGGVQGSVKFPGLSYYSASKAALATLSECLAEELSGRNIRVNCLALGSAQTEMFKEAFPEHRAPLSASEMASFICNFMTEGHKYFNGKIIPVSSSTP